MNEINVQQLVQSAFNSAGLTPVSIQIRTFPGEVIAIVEVDRDYEKALSVAQAIDQKIDNGFVTVRQVEKVAGERRGNVRGVESVHDDKVASLINLLNARSRTSESQPSLLYIKDVNERLSLAISSRHHLIFGRRGVGKTSLLLEARRIIEYNGDHTLWINIQSLRALGAAHAFLTVALRLCDLVLGAYSSSGASTASVQTASVLRNSVEQKFSANEQSLAEVAVFVPLLQQMCSRFCVQNNTSIYIFLDDIHYLSSSAVPEFLDLLHGITRDNRIWLKVAGIQHQTRWFIPVPPTGLQTGHDANIISLDVTLEHPEKAKEFLGSVLKGYIEECSAFPIGNVFSSSALERLVLASGGVPRDFLTLCALSIQTARQRLKAKTVGVQDVNNAAGIAGQTKLQELEDDAAATRGRSAELVNSLNIVRDYLLTEKEITFFKIDFRDKENHASEYRVLQALADLRMLHLINNSLSDQHNAGQRSEVYLLDLSQYSGARLKQGLYVLDFERGHIVMKRTRSNESPRAGDTVLKLLALLRRAPSFELSQLSEVASSGPELD